MTQAAPTNTTDPRDGPDRLLLVDDEEYVLRALRGHLASRVESGEVTVSVATDGPAAVEAASAAVAAGGPFDLAVIDFQMTDEMNGLETLQELRKVLPDITAIMLTGHAQQNTPVDALNLGFRRYLVKPASREAFLSAIDDQLRQIRLARHNRRLQAALAGFHASVQRLLAVVRTVADISAAADLPATLSRLAEAGLATASASDAFVLLLPDGESAKRDAFDLRDRTGRPLAEPVIPLGTGAAGMCLTTAAPVLRAAEEGKRLDGPAVEVGPLERGRSAVIAVPLMSGPRRVGALLLTDPARPENYADGYEAALAALGRLGGTALESALTSGRGRSLLLSTLRAAAAEGTAPQAGATGSLEQVEAGIRSLDSATLTAPGSGDATGGLAAGLDDAQTKLVLEMAAALRDIARFGPEGLEFCRVTLDGFRRVLRSYAG
jgi:ActR/RegA family two-component response regulator